MFQPRPRLACGSARAINGPSLRDSKPQTLYGAWMS